MDITKIDLSSQDLANQFVRGGSLDELFDDMLGMVREIDSDSGMDISSITNMISSVRSMLPNQRIELDALLLLGDENSIIESLHMLTLEVKHEAVLEELVMGGYIRAANYYCTHYSYTPSEEIAELAQEQVLPFFLEYIEDPRLVYNLSPMASALCNMKIAMNNVGFGTEMFDKGLLNDLIAGKDISKCDIDINIDLGIDAIIEALESDEKATPLIIELVKQNSLETIKLLVEREAYPLDKILDISYEYGQEDISNYILSVMPHAEEVQTISLDTLEDE